MKTVVVGMSGGVDSSVVAALLKEQGYNVIGLFMNNWEETDENGVCTSVADYEDVKRVCERLDIPYYSVNFSQEYMEHVFKYFLEEYKNGRTPNPDVLCNREIKFGPFLQHAKTLGANAIATGHYAKTVHEGDRVRLLCAKDENKDQTYFLNQLSQEQLKSVMFPLGDLTKAKVREIAEKYRLNTADKKDSTGICFIGERNFRKFLKSFLPATRGKIVNTKGEEVGEHEGAMYYTLGQRRGLNIGGKQEGNGRPWYVIDKDTNSNLLIVSQGEGEELFSKGLIASDFNWINAPEKMPFKCYAKFRYRQPDQEVNVSVKGDKVVVDFDKKQRAITPGQFVVLYQQYKGGDGDKECLGGGVIEEVIK